jgi:hypothetical protein
MISGYVDSQNTMGALLRTDIRASVDYNLGTGAWEISNIAELLK